MSAVFGMVRFDGRPILDNEIDSMSAALAAHGGDGCSTWTTGNAGFGHHLRIVTAEDQHERQPVRLPGGSHSLVFSGRLDNRKELLSQLGSNLDTTAVVPDSAIVSAAFERWGPACDSRLYGDFVFVAWQKKEQQIVAVRSPLSAQTLFYFWDGATLAFASSPSGLFALRFIRTDLDRERLADYVVHAPLEYGHSFFRDLRILESGSVLTVDRDGLRTKAFWNPGALPETRLKNDDEYLEAYLERFDQAVEARLRSAFPLTAMMSGGLDSSSVACTAAPMLARNHRRLLAFTQVPRDGFKGEFAQGWYADETPFVQAIARKYENIDLCLIRTEPRCVLDGHVRFIALAAAPFRNMGNRAWMEEILRQAQAAGSRAILTGTMGNIAFSWDGIGMLPRLIARGRFVDAWRQAKALKGRTLFRTLVGGGIIPLLPPPLWLAVRRHLSPDDPMMSSNPAWAAISPLRVEFVRSLRVEERARDKGCQLAWHRDHDSRETMVRCLRETERLASEIWCGLRSLYGVEERDPTSDRRVVDFCLSIPDDQFQRDGVSRRLTRRAMADRWPAEIVSNRGAGIQASDWHGLLMDTRPELQVAIDQLYSSPLAVEILDLDRMSKVLKGISNAPSGSTRTFLDVHEILYLGIGIGQFFEWIEATQRS